MTFVHRHTLCFTTLSTKVVKWICSLVLLPQAAASYLITAVLLWLHFNKTMESLAGSFHSENPQWHQWLSGSAKVKNPWIGVMAGGYLFWWKAIWQHCLIKDCCESFWAGGIFSQKVQLNKFSYHLFCAKANSETQLWPALMFLQHAGSKALFVRVHVMGLRPTGVLKIFNSTTNCMC